MKIAPLEIRRPETVAQALQDLASLGSDARVLAGGQSLIPLLRYRMATPYVLIDINGLSALDVLDTETDIRIGALVRHRTLEAFAHAEPQGQAPSVLCLMGQHAAEIGFWPVRARGTVIGSIVHADPQADWLLLMWALNAAITLESQRGRRILPVRDFVVGPLHVDRLVDELAIELTVPAARARPVRWGRHKLMRRAGDFAMASAVVVQYERSGWECWASFGTDVPCVLPATGSWLDTHAAAFEPEAFIRRAMAEIQELFPELGATQSALHAANISDAVGAALLQHPLVGEQQ